MGMKSEQKLMKLEDELKNIKATYSVYAGMMQTYLTSDHWHVSSMVTNLKIKFSPNYSVGLGKTIISSVYYQVVEEGEEIIFDDFYISIQDGSGDVVLNFGTIFENSDVYIQVTAPVPGTLTRI